MSCQLKRRSYLRHKLGQLERGVKRWPIVMPCKQQLILRPAEDPAPRRLAASQSVAERLAANHINISYAYCTAGAKGGRATGILKVADVKKAMKVLQENSKRLPKSQPQIRKTSARM